MDMENEEDEFLMQNQRQKVLENFSEYRPGYSGSNPTKKSNSIDREYDNDRGLSYRTVSRSKYFQQPSKNNLDGTTITADRLKSIQNNRNSFIRTDRYEDKYNAKETQKPVTAKFEDTQGTLIEGKVIKSEKSQYAEVFKRSIPRKIFRICCMTILLIASFFVYSIAEWIMLKRRTYLHIASSHSLTVNITNCYIYLSNQGTVSDRLEINLTAHEEKLTPSVIFKANLVEESFSASGTTSTLSVQHSYRDYTCKLFITWPINTALTKLNVTCDMCTILAKGDVRIDQFYFKALDGFMNIRRLTSVLPLDIQVENGALQLNHFESTSLANVVSLNNGTVVVQTKEELAVELDGTNKAYCFSAPFVDTVSAVTCAVTPFTLYAQERKYEKTSYNRCTGVSNICQTVGCTPLRKIKFKSIAGSIFVNYLEGDTLTVKDSNTHVSGLLPSEQGLNLPTDISHFKEILTQQQKPGKVPLSLRIDVGNLKGESSSVARYVLSEYPINTNMPLWLIAGSTFGTYLTNHQEIDISLNPGFCPYKPKLSKKQYLDIGDFIKNTIQPLIIEKSYLGVVFESTSTFSPSDGSQPRDHNDAFLPDSGFGEPMLVLLSNQDEKYSGIELSSLFKEDKFKNTNPLYLLAYKNLITLIPTLLILCWLFKIALQWFDYVRTRFSLNQSINPNTLGHDEDSEFYSYVFPDKRDSEVNETIKDESHVPASIFSIPSLNLIFELIIVQILHKISSSASYFYENVFELQTYEFVYDQEFIDQKETGIRASTLKDYYQQFTFWNYLEEEDLFSEKNLKSLMSKGFEIVTKEEDHPIFKKLLLKKYNSLQMFSDMNLEDYKTSLHAFIELICVQTSYDSDEVSFDLFASNYELFCNLFQLEAINIDIALMKREFNIDSFKRTVQMVERNQKLATGDNPNRKNSKKWYSLDLEKMVGYLNLVKGSNISDKIDPKRREEIMGQLIYQKHWVIREILLSISIFLFLGGCRYYLYSSIDVYYTKMSELKIIPLTEQLRSFFPFSTDGLITKSSKYFEMGNLQLQFIDYSLLIAYIAVMLGAFFCKDLTNYYNRVNCGMLHWSNLILSVTQWTIITTLVFGVTWLFCIYIYSSFLYSLYKIDVLLPYMFKTACLLYFIYLYVIKGKVVFRNSVESIQNELKNNLINRYLERLTLASNFSKEIELAEKSRFNQSMTHHHGFNEPLPQNEIDFSINQVMRELRDQAMIPLQWTSFIKSILFEERQKILNSLHDIAEHPPLSLPQGSLELIAKILSIDENMESPEYFLNIISTILVKLMMTNDKITYKKLRLKDLDILRICDCPENSLLNEKFVCESCKNEALYSKNHQEIFKLSLEKNTSIILSLINLVDLIRKKTPGKILEVLVDKIVPEGLVGEEKDTVSSLMRLFFLAFFEIDQKFSRIDWGKSINDILLNYFKDEQNILQVLNLFDESHDDNLFDISMQFITNTDAVNSVKRSVVLESCPKETQSISRFLSFSTLLIGKDCTIPEKMAKDFLQFINKNSRLQISSSTFTVIMKFLIFSRESPKSIMAKIRQNAEKYFLDPELSDTIKDIKSISFGINNSMKTKDYQNLENSRIVKQIKKLTNLQGIEIIGFIYLINNKQDNDEVSKFYSYLFHVSKLTKYESILFDLLAIFISNDHIKLSRAFKNLRLKYFRLFVYLRGIATRNSIAPLYVEEILSELPVASENYETISDMFREALKTRDFSRLLLFISSKINPDAGLDSKKAKNLRYLEFIVNLNSGQKLTEVLSDNKYLFKEFDDPLLYDFIFKLLVVLEYTIQRQSLNSDSISIKVKATKILSDMMITKSENISKFFDLFLSKRLEDFIDAYCYFDEEFKMLLEKNGKSLKNHIQYIEKSLWFLDEQITFYSTNPAAKFSSPEQEEDLGVIIMKKIMMPEIKLKMGEIILLLGSIINKIFNEDQVNSSNPQRIMKFFSNLFIYILGDSNSDLGDYFQQEHNESFIKMLINCRGSKSRSQRVNIFFEDLHKRDMMNTTLFLYFYQFLKKKLKREEFTLKNELEVQIATDLDLYIELFDYLDICINKNFNKFDQFVMSIHSRIQKHQGINSNAYKKDDIDWEQFYSNIRSLLEEKQPNLNFFSSLLKIPLNQLNFVYILNMLRNSTKADKVLNEANSSISFKEIVESINIAHSEVIQIMKLCLNKADFESMDILLKSMGLIDEIDINLVMSLITIDTQLKVDTDESRVLIKRMNLYSEVFKRMKIDKDLAWGFIRILKGDMFSFKKFLTIADDEAPLNHITFLGIVMALAGCRNTPFNHFKGDSVQTIPKLIEKYKEINESARQRKENSREVAHNLLKDYLQVSPLWGLVENQITKKLAGHTMVNQKIKRVIDVKETKGFTVFHFMILNSINNSSVDAIEIFSNLAFFHNVVFCLKNIMVSGSEECQATYKELLRFYIEIFENVKRKFKELLRKDLLTLTFNNNLTNYIIFNDLLTDNIENIGYYYYEKINKTLIDYWIDKIEREEVFQELIPKLQSLEHRSTLHSLFGTEPLALFKDPAIYDHFLESVTECMILEMKFLNSSFCKNSASSEQMTYKQENDLEEGDDQSLDSPNVRNFEESEAISEEANDESSDHESNKDLAMDEESQREEGNSLSEANEAEVKEEEVQEGVEKTAYVSNGIMDFCLYNLISRLKQGKSMRYEEKERHIESDQKKIDALFTLIEKLSFFTRNFSGFRKNKYSRLFTFSQGVIIGSDYPLRQKHSLYSPELVIQAQLHANKYNEAVIQENVDFPFEVKEFLGKVQMVKDLVEYDLVNQNYYSPFGSISFDLEHYCKVREVPRSSEGPSALHDCYYSPYLMRNPFSKVHELKRLANTSSQIHIFKLLTSPLKLINPEYLVFLLIEQGFYNLNLETEECQQVCRQVFLNFFGQNVNLTSKINESYKSNFDMKLEAMQDQLFFLHDMAIGLYQVLPETKNLFSENQLLSKNMKIYLAILKLHGTFNKFSEWTLVESLEILSPYLASDKEKLRVIIDYVRNSKKNLDEFVEIGLKLELHIKYFYELLLLFNQNKRSIIGWVRTFLGELGLSKNYVEIMSNILRLYTGLSDESKDFAVPKEEFERLMIFLMRIDTDTEKGSLKRTLGNAIYQIMTPSTSEVLPDIMLNEEVDTFFSSIDKLYQQKFRKGLDGDHIAVMLNFTNDVLDRKFVLFNPVKDFIEDLLTKQFGVNNTNLLNIFKLIDWLNSKKDSSSNEEIEKYFYEFLNYGNFNLMNLNIEKIKLVLLFLKNFNKADVTGILRFLRDLQLTKEYVYIFSRYIWITTLNKNLVHPQNMDQKLRASISMLLTFPFLEILHAEIIYNQPTLHAVLPGIEALVSKFTINISRIPFEKIFAIVNTNFNDYSKEKLFALLKGDTFSDYISTVNDNLSHFYDLISPYDMRPLVKKLQNLFYFNTKFFNDDEAAFVQNNFQPNHFIQLSIDNFLTLMNFQDQIQKLVEEGFQNKKNHFNYQFIKKKIQGLLSKKKKNPLAIPNSNRKEKGVKSRWDNLISSCHYLWFLKYYVLHMKKKYNGKLDDIKSYYRVIFLKLMKKFIKETMRRKEKRAIGGEFSKQEKARQEILMKYEDMCRSLATLFIEMKFKKNLNSVFHSLVLFLQIFVFKRGRMEKLKNFAKQINVESFFELYDNIYENKTIFNRNADNILRLSINTLRNFSFYNRLNRPGTRLLKVSRGSLKDIEKFLMDLLKRNDRVYWSMNQIKWCESFIKENNQRKRISERRKINSRMKSNSNVRAFNELSPPDQVLFIKNLKTLGSVKYEVIPFFESYITYDSSFYSKYDTFKIMRRMGFEMSIHRMNEIISESHDIRRFKNGNILEDQDCNLTKNEMRNCLVRVEQKIIDKVLEMKKLTTPYFCFMLFLAAFIMYVMNTMLDFVLMYFWTPTSTDFFLACLPTFVFYYLLARQFVRNFDSISDNKDQIEAAFTILYSNSICQSSVCLLTIKIQFSLVPLSSLEHLFYPAALAL